ncbi:FeoB-associated Cys-rich membrane protein [Pseudodesulfovibrio sp. S3]|uniref:FeoB-associated Cys-rich membrane protein n=1 Tax=Pseudodesulfovibrio sp. S3-i TaxID=2929474 RepID=UPI000FEBFCE9|nr:FeoB-associated Cys-rich membrane protein [Pseudodesulfovibrio sp. S3]
MGTVLAVVIIIFAGYYVFTKIRKQFQAKEGCGCSGCTSDSCGRGADCSDKK